MKKSFKMVLLIIGSLVLLIGIDIGSVLLRNKPIFAVKDDCDCLDQVYHGLLYDTYNCWEYPTAQIKPKWKSFSCTENVGSTLIYGEITELTDNLIIIKVLESNSSIKANDEVQISLLNNPTINGANNLIIGQYIQMKPKSIQETYPIVITTDKIDIINKK